MFICGHLATLVAPAGFCALSGLGGLYLRHRNRKITSQWATGLSVHSLHDSRRQISMCVCVIDMYWGQRGRWLIGTQKWNAPQPCSGVLSSVGLWAALRAGPDPFHATASFAPHICLSVESGEAIDYRVSPNLVDDPSDRVTKITLFSLFCITAI